MSFLQANTKVTIGFDSTADIRCISTTSITMQDQHPLFLVAGTGAAVPISKCYCYYKFTSNSEP